MADISLETIKRFFAADDRRVSALIAAAFYLAYVIAYLLPLQINFSYSGEFAINPTWWLLFLGAGVLVSIGYLLPFGFESQSLFLWLVFIVIVIPHVVVSTLSGANPLYPLLCLVAFLIVVRVAPIVSRLPRKELSAPRSLQIVIYLAIGALILGLFIWCVATMGFPSVDAFNYENVYEIRGQNTLGSLETALLTLVCMRIIPVVLCISILSGFWWVAVLISLVQVFFFLWTANTSWLLLIALVWIVSLVVKKKPLSIKRASVVVLIVLVFFSFASLLPIPGTNILFSFGVRRLVIIPALLGQGYFDFFSDGNSLVWLQNTILSFLTPMPDQYASQDYPFQIAQFVYGESSTAYANTGLFGGEIANFGSFFGIVVAAVNVIAIYVVLGIIDAKRNRNLLHVVAVLCAFLLLNTSSIRLLLSPTGLVATLITICLVIMFPGDDAYKNRMMHNTLLDHFRKTWF